MRIDPIDRIGRDVEYQRLHLAFMTAWWSGEVLSTVCDPTKADAARQALARLS